MAMTDITTLMEPKMLLRFLAAASLSTALLLQVATSSEAAALISEDFESATPALSVTSIPSFTVNSGTVDVIGTGTGFDFYPNNGKYLDLNGSSAAIIESAAFNFAAGDTVTLKFDYGANGENRSADVFFGNALLTTLNASESTGTIFTPYETTFTLGSATTASVLFSAVSTGAAGIILDNVVLTTSAVPEPATLPALLTLGVVGGALVLRRKQSTEQA
jgi:PEP-CTERM motif